MDAHLTQPTTGPEVFETFWKDAFVRFSDHANIKELTNKRVTIVGTGSIGSMVAIAIAKMGIGDIMLCDFDHVEIHNTGNQLFGPYYCGMSKTEALKDLLTKTCLTKNIEILTDRYTKSIIEDSDIIVSAADSFLVRRQLIQDAQELKKPLLFLDYRSGGGQLEFRALNPINPRQVKEFLKATPDSDDVGENHGCTGVGSIGAPMLAASLTTMALTKLANNQDPTGYIIAYVKDVFQVLYNTYQPE